jgi:hypothetical protein
LQITFSSVLNVSRCVAQVWDHDPLTSDDYLGTALIPLPPPPRQETERDDDDEDADDDAEVDVTPRAGAAAAPPAVAVVTAAGGASPRAAVSLAAAALDAQGDVAVTESVSEKDDAAAMRRRTAAASTSSSAPMPRVTTAHGATEGWFVLEAAPQHAASVRDTLRRLGRGGAASSSASPDAPLGIPRGALGEVYARVAWGDGVRRAGAAAADAMALLRPQAHRECIGTLTVTVLQARALPPPPRDAQGCAPAVTVRCERQRGATRRATRAASDVAWCCEGADADADAAAAAATFSFDVTEITSEVTFTVQHRSGGEQTARGGGDTPQQRKPPRTTAIGEVCLPLPLLLAQDAAAGVRAALRGGAGHVAAAPPRWARILPRRAHGDPFFREGSGITAATDDDGKSDDDGMAAAPLGLLRYEARLTLRRPVAWCYAVPEVSRACAEGTHLRRPSRC